MAVTALLLTRCMTMTKASYIFIILNRELNKILIGAIIMIGQEDNNKILPQDLASNQGKNDVVALNQESSAKKFLYARFHP